MKKTHRKQSKYENDAVIAEGKVCKIDYKNMLVGTRYKTVFYCPSQLCPEGRMCVYWGRTNIDVGDEIETKGRFSDGVFLAWSILIRKKAEKQENGSI